MLADLASEVQLQRESTKPCRIALTDAFSFSHTILNCHVRILFLFYASLASLTDLTGQWLSLGQA